jgi:hypothetical protein
MVEMETRTIAEIAEQLRHLKVQGRKCTLMLGAGCSVEAGIPAAGGFVECIQERFPVAYEKEPERSYAKLMTRIGPGPARDLIAEFIDRAKINWGHLAIAQLMKNGYVDRTLTTNFDPLIVRACAMINLFPAVYDLAASPRFEAKKVPDPAVFYLHGQRSGFLLMNEPEVLAAQAERLAPVFNDGGGNRLWIVVGYSGENDPLLDRLASVNEYEYGLFWVAYKDNAPATNVIRKLLQPGKRAFLVPDCDADSFFMELANALDCFPPEFLARPFSHLDVLLKNLTTPVLPGQTTPTTSSRQPTRTSRTVSIVTRHRPAASNK